MCFFVFVEIFRWEFFVEIFETIKTYKANVSSFLGENDLFCHRFCHIGILIYIIIITSL